MFCVTCFLTFTQVSPLTCLHCFCYLIYRQFSARVAVLRWHYCVCICYVVQLFVSSVIPESVYMWLAMKTMLSASKRARQKQQKAQWSWFRSFSIIFENNFITCYILNELIICAYFLTISFLICTICLNSRYTLWSKKFVTLFISLSSLQTLTNFYNIWYVVYRVNLQHNNYGFTHLTYILLLHYLEEN